MSGPIVRTGATPEFWSNWDNVFGGKKGAETAASKKKATAKKAPAKSAGKKVAVKKSAKPAAKKSSKK
ncbi:MAG: RNA polymerase subunit sigma [Planctomycetaceae bacterium]|nr:RNA polymerase subunit sigma [Planctomycetaceae bacterium]MCA9109054.1 RNA polymerase subunit sigma [Planctomycetaceae bacterium]